MADFVDMIVVGRCDRVPRPPIAEPPTVGCEHCKAACWIAPPTVAHLRKHPEMLVVCWDCAIVERDRRAASGHGLVAVRLVSGSVHEGRR